MMRRLFDFWWLFFGSYGDAAADARDRQEWGCGE
jgi:hypothetical protein